MTHVPGLPHPEAFAAALLAVAATPSNFVIPGPPAVIWWGVHVPSIAAAFGVVGILLGHFIAPVPAVPLPMRRQLGVLAGGIMLSIAIAISTGQRPLVVLAWSLGIGFSGITIFQTLGSQVAAGSKDIADIVIDKLKGRIGGQDKDSAP